MKQPAAVATPAVAVEGAAARPTTSTLPTSPEKLSAALPQPTSPSAQQGVGDTSIAAKTEAALAAASEPTSGTLQLAINPWGEVWVDGRMVGVTPPLRQLFLPPGPHEIMLRNGESPDVRKTIEVKAGQTVRVRHQF